MNKKEHSHNELDRKYLGREVYNGLLGKSHSYLNTFKEANKLTNRIIKNTNWKDKKIAKTLKQLLRPSLKIKFAEYGADSLFYGCSKFGGTPDLSKEIVKSIFLEGLHPLLCQINLSDFHSFKLPRYFPTKGILYFFFNEHINSPTQSKIIVHYEEEAILETQVTTKGYKALFYPIYTFPSALSKSSMELISLFPEEEINIESFTEALRKELDYTWLDTILFCEPFFLQAYPFEIQDTSVISLLDFSYKEVKYHIGITIDNLRNKNFSQIQCMGQTT